MKDQAPTHLAIHALDVNAPGGAKARLIDAKLLALGSEKGFGESLYRHPEVHNRSQVGARSPGANGFLILNTSPVHACAFRVI
jgi:hypothetical protein